MPIDRTAKVKIGLNLKQLKADTDKASQLLKDIGKVKIDRSLRDDLRKIVGDDLKNQAVAYKDQIKQIQDKLRLMGREGKDAFDPRQINDHVRALSKLQQGLRNVHTLQSNIRRGGGLGNVSEGTTPSRLGRGAIAGMGGLAGSLTGPLAALGIGIGVQQALSRSVMQAEAGLKVRELTGGGLVGDESRFGFTRMERRERALDIAGEAGRDLTTEQMTKLVDQAELMQRAFGISGQQYGAAIGGARRAGIDDQAKFVSDTLSNALVIGLEGSAIGEYLSKMTEYLGSVSKEVQINERSLRGFAGALGQMDFFKADPARIFDAISKLETIFRGGGTEYQQFASYRAIQTTALQQTGDVLSPSGVEVRRSLGLFGAGGERDEKLQKELTGAGLGGLARVLGVGGDKVLSAQFKSIFEEAKAVSGGLKTESQQQQASQLFQENTGLKNRAGFEIFSRLAMGKDVTPELIEKAKRGYESPEDRWDRIAKSFEQSVKNFDSRIERIKDQIADGITGGVIGFVSSVDKFSEAVGMFESDTTKLLAGLALIVGGKELLGTLGTKGMLGPAGLVVGAGVAGVVAGNALGERIEKDTTRVNKYGQEYGSIEKGIAAFQAYVNPVSNYTPAEFTDTYVESPEEKAKRLERESKLPNNAEIPGGVLPALSSGGYLALAGGGKVRVIGIRKDGSKYVKSGPTYGGKDVETVYEYDDPSSQKEKDSSTFAQKVSMGVSGLKRKGKAAGGAIGTDTVDAKLTPGEFVVNARASSSNMLALVHANSGGRIKPYAGGGVVGGGMSSEMPEIPSSLSIDSSTVEMALGGNTRAITALTQVLLMGGGKAGSLRDFPRGNPNLRFGHG